MAIMGSIRHQDKYRVVGSNWWSEEVIFPGDLSFDHWSLIFMANFMKFTGQELEVVDFGHLSCSWAQRKAFVNANK